MKILTTPPNTHFSDHGLRLPQIRVLLVCAKAKALTRARIAERLNKSAVLVGKAIGYSDPDRRAAFEQTKDGGGSPGNPHPSLLTRKYVKEVPLDIDGVEEVGVIITPAGRHALDQLPASIIKEARRND